KEVYGLVVMDRREGMIALLKGKSIIPLQKSTSNVPGKTRAGGQSAARFERLREGAAKEFYSRLGEHMKEQFLHQNALVKGIIVGGPGPTKQDFVEGDYITSEVKKKIIGLRDLSYTGEFGLQELVDRSQDLLAKEEIAEEKQVTGEFFKLLSTDPDRAAYGRDDVLKKLRMGAVDKLLLSESLADSDITLFEKEAENLGSTVFIISTETREGVQIKEIGGFAGILRYKIET
ncbi:peptide chain release factor 1, partial [Candidatus Woesearchaeota archaeon CG_4_10_14_0_8_um_filter_47_5]